MKVDWDSVVLGLAPVLPPCYSPVVLVCYPQNSPFNTLAGSMLCFSLLRGTLDFTWAQKLLQASAKLVTLSIFHINMPRLSFELKSLQPCIMLTLFIPNTFYRNSSFLSLSAISISAWTTNFQLVTVVTTRTLQPFVSIETFSNCQSIFWKCQSFFN